jgi:tetratricopeptide (TPR) repeat protein
MTAMEDTANQHFIIGDNLRHKAFYEDAIDEFQKALHIQEPLLGVDSVAVARTHYCLGLALRAVRNYTQALYHLNKASRSYENQVGDLLSGETVNFKQEILDCKLNMARSHHSQGVEYQRSGEYDRSIVEHRKALAIREHLLGRTSLESARSYYVIGCALSDRGDFDEALAELRRALRTRLLIFGKHHMDSKEVVDNIGTVCLARASMTTAQITDYMGVVVQSLEYENEGDYHCRKGECENGMVCYRKALSLEEQCMGDLHPTTCDLYLRMADALGQIGDLEASLVEYRSAIAIYERMMGKFHVKVANIYNKLAGILMDKGEYETALSFYAKAYGIYDSILGNHDDTKQAMMNLRLAAAKERTAKESMDLIKRAEQEFKQRQQETKRQEEETSKKEDEVIKHAGKNKKKTKKKNKEEKPKEVPKVEENPDII